MYLKGKTALITRSGDEIGQAMALRFAEEGAWVLACDSNQATSERVKNLVKKKKGKAVALAVDLCDPERVSAMVAGVVEKYGHIDILVNHVDYFDSSEFLNMPAGIWDHMLQRHLSAYFHVTQCVVQNMSLKQYGKIVNLLTNVHPSIIRKREQVHYQTVCSGIEGFTKALAEENGKYGITANCIIAENIDTEALRKRSLADGLYKDDLMKIAAALIPLERLGTADEVAEIGLFFASDVSAYVTGQIINVKGGP